MARSIAIVGLLFVIILSIGCVVHVPDLEDNVFACKSSDDCAKGYECKEGFCVKPGEKPPITDCRIDDCDPIDGKAQVCSKQSDGSAKCVPACIDGQCGPGGRCVHTLAYADNNEIETELCVMCTNCPSTKFCVVTSADNNGYLDLFQTECKDQIDCEIDQNCQDQNAGVCLPRLIGGHVCRPVCDTNHPCLDQEAESCTSVRRSATDASTSIFVCMACPGVCTEAGESCNNSENPTSGTYTPRYLDEVSTNCECSDNKCKEDLTDPTAYCFTGTCIGGNVEKVTISGKISIDNTLPAAGTIKVYLLKDTAPNAQKLLEVPLSFTNRLVIYSLEVAAGTYMVRALMDYNNDGIFDPFEPDGLFPNDGNGNPALRQVDKSTTNNSWDFNVGVRDVPCDPPNITCPTGSVCDISKPKDTNGKYRCRIDCSMNNPINSCSLPDVCGLTPTLNDDGLFNATYACIPTPCTACNPNEDVCMVEPMSLTGTCYIGEIINNYCEQDANCSIALGYGCANTGLESGMGECLETCNPGNSDYCTVGTDICLPAPRQGQAMMLGICKPKPECSAGCGSDNTCMYIDQRYLNEYTNYSGTTCVMGCMNDGDCMNGACVQNPRFPSGNPPMGICRPYPGCNADSWENTATPGFPTQYI